MQCRTFRSSIPPASHVMVVNFWIWFLFSFKKHNWLSLEMNTYIHTLTQYFRINEEKVEMKLYQETKKRYSNKITQNYYQFNKNNWVLWSNEYTGDVFLGSASGQYLQNDDCLINNPNFKELFCEWKQWKYTSWTATLNIKCPQMKTYLARHWVVNNSTQLRVAPSSTIYKPQLCFLNTRCLPDTEEKNKSCLKEFGI